MAVFQPDWTDENLCHGKNKYSKNEAQRMKGIIGRGRDKAMRIYECEECGKWHLTKKSYHSY